MSEAKTTAIDQHEGNKYLRTIFPADGQGDPIRVDVYAAKKLLCAGIRGKGNELDDLVGALAAINRAIEMEIQRQESKP